MPWSKSHSNKPPRLENTYPGIVIEWGDSYWAPTATGDDIEPLIISASGTTEVLINRKQYREKRVKLARAAESQNAQEFKRTHPTVRREDLNQLIEIRMKDREQEIEIKSRELFDEKRQELMEFAGAFAVNPGQHEIESGVGTLDS